MLCRVYFSAGASRSYMEPDLIFDMQRKAYDWSVWQVGILFLGGLFILWLGKRRARPAFVPGVGYFLCVAAVLFAAFEVGSYFLDRRGKVRLLNNGRCSVIEGVVTDFHPMPASGHAMESFEIAGQKFTYSDYVLTPCFNNTTSHGGPIREGLAVKIWYSENCIMRITTSHGAGTNFSTP